MHKNGTNRLVSFHAALADSITELGGEGFYGAVTDALGKLIVFEYPLLIHYPVGATPQVLYFTPASADDYEIQIQRYLQGPFLLDPFYQASLQGAAGAFALKEVAPDNFKLGQFYREYYKATQVGDEVSFLQPLPEGGHLHLSLSRGKGQRAFSAAEVRQLKAVATLIGSLLLKHQVLSQRVEPPSQATDLHMALEQALNRFGRSLLTPREQNILTLILRGHSSKSIAARLDISIATVKRHRQQMYQKLDINTQAELFHLFIDSMSCLTPESEDPLEAYLARPL